MFFQLRITLRNLYRGGIYSIINIGGLAIGMAAVIIIMLWVYHQWSFDRFHAKDKYLYKVWCYDEANGNFSNVGFSIGPALVDEYAGFANMTRYNESEVPLRPGGNDGQNYTLSTVVVSAVDTGFLNMFSFPLLRGDASTALKDPYSIIFTQSAARRMFGDRDMMGETIWLHDVMNFNVTGILADLPDNTGFGFEVLIPFDRSRAGTSWSQPGGKDNRTYVELSPHVDVKTVSASIRNIVSQHTGGRFTTETHLQHISKWYLYSNFERGISVGGRIEMLRMFVLIALLILLIACINFMNLSTARSAKYAREVGVRKVVGAHRSELILRFLGESTLISAIAGGCALLMVLLVLPFFNAIVGEHLNLKLDQGAFWIATWILFILISGILIGGNQSFQLSSSLPAKLMKGAIKVVNVALTFLAIFSAVVGENLSLNLNLSLFWIAWALFILITGVLAGSYPAFYLSSFRPVKVLKGYIKVGNGIVTPRKALIVTQFVVAIVLITSTLVIHRQINYSQARDIGYDKSRLISFQINDNSRPHKELIRRELLETGIARSVSINFASMTESMNKRTDHLRWRGKVPGNPITFERNYAEADWAKTTGVQIIQGRDIDIREYPGDSTAMLLNETAVKVMGFDDPIGEIVYEWDTQYRVVGVVKDFVLESPYDPIRPMVIGGPANNWFTNIIVKLNDQGSIAEHIGRMEQIFSKYAPNDGFQYRIVDEVYARHFDKEQRIGSLVSWFAALAVFISCLGLFGLSAYMAENRRKEIGIRKVLGASIFDIVKLLTKEFLILVTVSLVIALPVAWWVMNRWLDGFAYRTNIPWWLLVAVAALTIGIALVTVSWQAIRSAMADPVKAIKSE